MHTNENIVVGLFKEQMIKLILEKDDAKRIFQLADRDFPGKCCSMLFLPVPSAILKGLPCSFFSKTHEPGAIATIRPRISVQTIFHLVVGKLHPCFGIIRNIVPAVTPGIPL